MIVDANQAQAVLLAFIYECVQQGKWPVLTPGTVADALAFRDPAQMLRCDRIVRQVNESKLPAIVDAETVRCLLEVYFRRMEENNGDMWPSVSPDISFAHLYSPSLPMSLGLMALAKEVNRVVPWRGSNVVH